MLFITNRFPRESLRSRNGRPFTFDLKNNSVSNSVFFGCRVEDGVYEEIGSYELLRRLKGCEYRQVLIYIHGFSNMPEEVFRDTKKLQELCDLMKANEVLVLPMIWPCDNDLGIVKDYWNDQKAADASALAFARVFAKFMAWRNSDKYNPTENPCLKRINVLAHSMGNRVLRETIASWNRYDLANGVPLLFRNTFMVAADVVNESLESENDGRLIAHASRNVIVYHASDDLALRASKAANLKNKVASRRLGHTGPENMDRVPQNVYSVDCDDVNTLYDPPAGHSYFCIDPSSGKPGKVFEHIFQALLTGRVYPDDEFRRTSILPNS